MTPDKIMDLIDRLRDQAIGTANRNRSTDDVLDAAKALSTLLEERERLREALEAAQIYIDRIPAQNMLAFQIMEKTIKDALSPQKETA